MPRGVYKRKGHKGNKRKAKNSDVLKLLSKMREARERAQDEVVALGTAIEALEVLE